MSSSSGAFEPQPWDRIGGPWELPPAVESDSESDDDNERAEGADAGEMLAQMLLAMVWSGKMSAKTACVIAWWASRAGAQGPIKDIAFRPSAPTGHGQRKIDSDSSMGLKNHHRYMVKVPRTTRYDYSRSTHDVPMVTAHEAIESDMAETPDLLARLEAQIAKDDLPLSYDDHPVRRAHEGLVLPLAIFLDGVQFNKRSGMLAIYLYNLVTGVRHMLCVVRKSEIARAGADGGAPFGAF